ncbi:MAG: hypothetical protein LBK58_03120 [Prevotellaceae bacterium]|jgi:hypothetical protein|nr:hypothetical protein [Prevotellaceae bacterium]
MGLFDFLKCKPKSAELFEAAKNGDAVSIGKLLAKGADVNAISNIRRLAVNLIAEADYAGRRSMSITPCKPKAQPGEDARSLPELRNSSTPYGVVEGDVPSPGLCPGLSIFKAFGFAKAQLLPGAASSPSRIGQRKVRHAVVNLIAGTDYAGRRSMSITPCKPKAQLGEDARSLQELRSSSTPYGVVEGDVPSPGLCPGLSIFKAFGFAKAQLLPSVASSLSRTGQRKIMNCLKKKNFKIK